MRCMTRLKLFTTWIDKVMADIRELIFQKNGSDKVTAGIYTDSDGIVSGIPAALKKAEEIGLSVTYAVHEGEDVFAGDIRVYR